MNLVYKLNTLHLYIRYFFNVVDRHSIQPPFAYQFFNKLKDAIDATIPIHDIEKERQAFASDSSLVAEQDFGAGSKFRDSSVSSIARFGISSIKSCIFLHQLANTTNAATCIELGTSLGIATAYLARSRPLKRLYSFEGNKALAEKAKGLLTRLEIDNVQIIEGNIDRELPALLDDIASVDLAIIDANHTKKALIAYYEMLRSKMNSHGVIYIDDIRWSRDMYLGWQELCLKQEVSISMEFLEHGLLFFEKGMQKQHYVLTI